MTATNREQHRSASKIGARILRYMLAATLVLNAGCRLWNGRRISNPLSYQQQVAEIRKIVPLGTPRGTAVTLLKKSGIEGDFGEVGSTIFYCRIWNRKNGERWHLQASLLFDHDGKFYSTLLNDTVALTSEDRTVTADSQSFSTTRKNEKNSEAASRQQPSFAGRAADSRQPDASANPHRNGRRTPFANLDDLR